MKAVFSDVEISALTLSLIEIVESTVNSVFFIWYIDFDLYKCRILELTAASTTPTPINPYRIHEHIYNHKADKHPI